MTRPRLPPGARFAPTEEELIKYYLSKKIKGEPFSANFVIERDMYDTLPWKVLGDESLPWQISKVKNKAGSVVGVDAVIYVITKLKKASQNRISRVAGCGVWHGEGGPYKIWNGKGAEIGTKKTFSFKVVANDDGLEDKTEKVGHWIMHEFSSTTEESNYVICKISRDDSKPLKIAPQKGKKNSSSTKRANNNNVSSTDQDEDDNYALLLEAELEVFNMEEEATHDEDDIVADQYSTEQRQTMTEDNERTQLNNTLGEYSVAQVDNNTLGDEHDQDDQCPNLNQDLLLIRGLTNHEFDQHVRLQQEQEYSVAPPCTQVDINTHGDEHDQDDHCPNLNQDLLLIRGLTNDEFDQLVRLQQEQDHRPPLDWTSNSYFNGNIDQVNEQHHSSHNFDVLHYY